LELRQTKIVRTGGIVANPEVTIASPAPA